MKPQTGGPTVIHDRFDFAHILRGIAALSVVISHFAGVFWMANPDIMDLIGLPRIPTLPTVDPFLDTLISLRLVFGMFGVGIFYVLSGFVIALAIERESQRTFFVRRLMRVYPAYMFGFLLVMSGLFLANSLADQPFKYSLSHVLVHTLILVRGAFGLLRIDGISWTLEVELVFYAVMLVLGRAILRTGLSVVRNAVLAILALSLLLITLTNYGFVGVQTSCGLMLASGVVYALHVKKRIDDRDLLKAQAILLGLLIAVWIVINFRLNMSLQWLAGYIVGMVVFAASYWWYRQRRFTSRVLNHLADISYPLYVVHGLLGYAVMYWVVTRTQSLQLPLYTVPYLAITAAVVCMYGLAVFLHIVIEKPFIRWSRHMTADAPVAEPPLVQRPVASGVSGV